MKVFTVSIACIHGTNESSHRPENAPQANNLRFFLPRSQPVYRFSSTRPLLSRVLSRVYFSRYLPNGELARRVIYA